MTRTRSALAALALAALPPAGARAVESGSVEVEPGVAIAFERHGSGAQFVLVPNRLFMPEFRRLARPERTLVLYDTRIRGKSSRVADPARITILADVADVEALRRHCGAGRLSLVGYSYLGLAVALYAADHPERVERLVQIGPVPRKYGTAYPADQTADAASLSPEGQAALAAWRAARDAATPETTQQELCRALGRFLAIYLVGDPARHAGVPDVCDDENEWFANQTRHLDAHFGDLEQRDFPKERFTALPHPVLTVHGTLDRNAPYGAGLEWAATFRDGRLVTVPGGAHQVWLDDPAVLDEIDQFLSGRWPARARAFGRE
jgi:pimeloyl-ACP methyl ester carboxylesterase